MTAPTDQTGRIWDHPFAKWVSSILQGVILAFVTWLGASLINSVTSFSSKLDGVVSSVSTISQEFALQKRDLQDVSLRTSKVESKVEVNERQTARLMFQVEQLEKDRSNGR